MYHPLCIYHRSDLDGKCSAAIVNHALKGEVEFFGYHYGDTIPWDRIEGRDIIMVDISFQPFTEMMKVRDMCAAAGTELVWIDHHKTAIEAAEAADFMSAHGGASIAAVLGNDKAACELTWDWFFGELQHDKPALPTPPAVHLLGRYDVWKWQDVRGALEFQYGMRNRKNDPTAEIWPQVFNGEHVGGILQDGKTILDYQRRQDKNQVKYRAFVTKLNGLRCLACNSGTSGSQLFASLWDQGKYDAMLVFQWSPKGHWTCSLYTDKPGIDVSLVARYYGGGGHKGAAGFQCETLPFELTAEQPSF